MTLKIDVFLNDALFSPRPATFFLGPFHDVTLRWLTRAFTGQKPRRSYCMVTKINCFRPASLCWCNWLKKRVRFSLLAFISDSLMMTLIWPEWFCRLYRKTVSTYLRPMSAHFLESQQLCAFNFIVIAMVCLRSWTLMVVNLSSIWRWASHRRTHPQASRLSIISGSQSLCRHL